MIEGVVVQGEGDRCVMVLDEAILNQKERRRKGHIKERSC